LFALQSQNKNNCIDQEVALLNQVYDRLRLMMRFFYHLQKIISKTRRMSWT